MQGALVAGVFLASALGFLSAAVRFMDTVGTERAPVGSSLMTALAPQLEKLQTSQETGGSQLVFLGDSISIATTGRARPVPQLLRERLASTGQDVELHSLAALGTGPFDYYFLADEIASAGAEGAVVALSLNAFGESFRKLNRKQLSGWTAPGRLVEAAGMPLHWIGLTYDQLLGNVLIVRTGGLPLWHAFAVEQARTGLARQDAARWLGERLGRRGVQTFQLARFNFDRRRTRLPGVDRYNGPSELRHYGPVLTGLAPDHPVLVMLAGATRRLAASGLSTLVYVNPINVEHLTAVGVLPSATLGESLALVRAAVEDAGGSFLDLHALLPDEAFRDAAGHFGGQAVNGPERIADAVGEALGYSPWTTVQ